MKPLRLIYGVLLLVMSVSSITFFILSVLNAPRIPRSIREAAINSVIADLEADYAKGRHIIDDPLEGCSDPCVIVNNYGGHMVSFIFAARTLLKRTPHGVRILGECASACALFADLARPYVCIGLDTVMAFHRATPDNSVPPHSPDIDAWVLAHGGYPDNPGGGVLIMVYPDTEKFWPLCANPAGIRAGQ